MREKKTRKVQKSKKRQPCETPLKNPVKRSVSCNTEFVSQSPPSGDRPRTDLPNGPRFHLRTETAPEQRRGHRAENEKRERDRSGTDPLCEVPVEHGII